MAVATQDRLKQLRDAHGRVVTRLAKMPLGGYAAADVLAAEPIAWATQALAAAGRREAAGVGADWLAEQQQADGSVGVTEAEQRPAWTTALAVLAWKAAKLDGAEARIDRALGWAESQAPWTAPRNEVFGHDSSLEGWSWAADTHSWLEPTAFFVRAFHEAGRAQRPRAQEGVRLLVDRLLPSGGANYGNTTVLGQELLPHVQSSGVAAWALAETEGAAALTPTLAYLQESLAEPTGIASLCWAAIGLAVNNSATEPTTEVLLAAKQRVDATGGVYKPALYALACQAVLSRTSGGLG